MKEIITKLNQLNELEESIEMSYEFSVEVFADGFLLHRTIGDKLGEYDTFDELIDEIDNIMSGGNVWWLE
ncbi:MAG: hypothetical protein GY865_11730 [candidate division Zixibacteria bacterium]|nr:hypothetical protein [candidate division Zixibacteria bacterium]